MDGREVASKAKAAWTKVGRWSDREQYIPARGSGLIQISTWTPQAIDNLVHGYEVASEALGEYRAVNLPGMTVTAGEMVKTLGQVAGTEVAARVRWERDPAIERIVGTWPGAWDVSRAQALGFAGDADFAGIVRAYIEDDLPAAV